MRLPTLGDVRYPVSETFPEYDGGVPIGKATFTHPIKQFLLELLIHMRLRFRWLAIS